MTVSHTTDIYLEELEVVDGSTKQWTLTHKAGICILCETKN